MKKIISSLCICLTALSAHAQSASSDKAFVDYQEINAKMAQLRENMFIRPDDFETYFDGSPFLDKTWKKGEVVMTNGQKIAYEMLYNIYENQFWIKKETEIRTIIITGDIAYVELEGKKFVFYPYLENDRGKAGLLESLADGKFKLLKLYTSKYIAGQKKRDGYQGQEKDKFVTRAAYYYLKDGQTALELPLKQADFFELFGDQSAMIADFCKSHKLKLKKEADLIQIFNYYNTL